MKEFNLELAKAGHPVCTRDGKPARIICFDSNMENFPIVAIVTFGDNEELELYTEKGKFFKTEQEDEFDLMMVSEVKDDDDKRIKEAISYAIANSTHEDGILLNWVTESEAIAWLEKQGEQGSLNTNQVCLKGIKRVQEYQDLSDWEKKFDNIASMYANNKNQEGYNNSWYVKERAAAMLYHAKKELEKKCEKKPADKVEPKFKVGDWVIDKQDIVHQIANVVENTTRHTYGYVIVGGGYFNDNTEGVRLWTIEDAKDGDVLAFDNNTIVMFKDLYNSTTFHSYCHIENGIFDSNKDELPDWWEGEGFKPATKEQRDLLFTKIKEAGYEWDVEKKELKKIEQTTMLETCEIENIEHGKYYYCIKDYFCGGRKQASKGDVVQALRGMSMMALGVKANEYFLPVNSIKQNTAWSKEDELVIHNIVLWLDGQYISERARIKCLEWFNKHCIEFLTQPQQKQEWGEEDEEHLNSIIESYKYLLRDYKACHDWDYIPYDSNTVARTVTNDVNFLKSLKYRVQPRSKYEWKQENTDALTDFENLMMHIGISFFGQHAGLNPNDTNAIKEQANILLGLVPKQEWSEKDNYILSNIYNFVAENLLDKNRYACADECLKFIKVLKERCIWKPSDEQMDALAEALSLAKSCGEESAFDLRTLHEQLKKLREE